MGTYGRRRLHPLQYSCLENPMDRGAWWAAVHGVAKSRTWLRDFPFSFMHWRRKWHPTPVFLPGESQGRGSLVGCRLWGPTESDTTEATSSSMGTYSKEVQWIVCHARSPRWGYFKRGFKDKLELIERMEKGRRKRNIWDERLLESPKAGWIRCLERKERRKESLSGARAKWSGRKVAEDGAEKIDGWGQIDTGPCGPL